MASTFFIIFFLTILFSRVALFIYPLSSPLIGKFRMHHYMYGIAAVPLAVAANIFTLYAIGLALIVDELTFILMRGKNHKDYRSTISIVGTLLFIGVVFFIKDYLVIPFA